MAQFKHYLEQTHLDCMELYPRHIHLLVTEYNQGKETILYKWHNRIPTDWQATGQHAILMKSYDHAGLFLGP